MQPTIKQLSTIIITLFFIANVSAQNVGIGTTTPAVGALLELNSSSKALLLPRINNIAMNTLGAGGADGMLIYNTDQNGLFVRRSGQFTRLSDTSRPFVLPYAGSATNSLPLFQIQNFGTGSVFYGLSSSNTNAVIKADALGDGDGVKATAGNGNGISAFTSAGVAVQGISSTSGYGGFFSSSSGSALVTNLGNVGLGTLSPDYKLDVNGRMRIRNNGVTSGLWLNKADNTEGSFIGMINDTTAGFWGNGTVGNWKVGIDVKNGLMGIGTVDPSAPLSFSNTIGNKINLWGDASGGHYGLGIQGSLLQMYSENATSDIAFGYGNSTLFTERMRIKGSGNIGIATSNPNQLFTVSKNGIGIAQQSTDATTQVGFYTSAGNAYVQTHTNNDLNFATNNGSPQLTLKTNGNFGIGTTNPGAKLEVTGNTSISGDVRINNGQQAVGKVLVSSDAFGWSTWRSPAFGAVKLTIGDASITSLPLNTNYSDCCAYPFTQIAENVDISNAWNSVTNVYTVPETGTYQFFGEFPLYTPNANNLPNCNSYFNYQVQLLNNAVVIEKFIGMYDYNCSGYSSPSYKPAIMNTIVNLTAGDQISFNYACRQGYVNFPSGNNTIRLLGNATITIRKL